MNRSLVAVLSFVGLVACADDFDPPSLLSRPRVLGYVLSVEGDPERTDPMRGETLRIEVPWALPAGPVLRTYRGYGCVALEAGFGVPGCDSTYPVTELEARAEAPDALTLTWTVPVDVPEDRELLLFGGSCAGGEVGTLPVTAEGVVTDDAFTVCTSPDVTGELLQTPIALVDDASAANRGPSPLVDVTLAGRTLPPTGASIVGEPCADRPELPTLRVEGEPAELVVTANAESLESFPAETEGELDRESLQVALIVTSGETSANFLFLEADDLSEDAEVTPAEDTERSPGPEGSLERVVLSLRDGRGGLVIQDVAFCLLPALP
jgi:hypothetical protein